MSKKSNHYRNALDKIHHKLIQEEFERSDKKTIESRQSQSRQVPNNAILIVRMKLTEMQEGIQDEFYKIPEWQPEHDVSVIECFHAGGGYEIEGVPSFCNNQRFGVDDEDYRFGDPTSVFEERLEAFGTIVGESVKLFFPKVEMRTKRAEKAIPAHLALPHF